ncbi:MAG: glycosyltransferase family 2 protein [Candidatus Binatia bacterium]
MNSFSTAASTISVVVPVYNGGDNFRDCLASIARAVPPPSELIVVADGDADNSWQIAANAGARVIRLPHQGGPARARNIGARAARGELLFFVDADVTISQQTLASVVSMFAANPEVAALFGSYDDDPAAANFLSQYKNLLHHYVHQTASEEASTFWGACGAIRRDVFLAMGGFDEHYQQPSIEDVELGYRLKRAGYRIRLCKELQVKHLKQWTAPSLFKTDFFCRALPWTELIWREGRLLNDLNVRVDSRLSVILVSTLIATVLAAWWWPWSLTVAVGILFALVIVNAPVYRFFVQKRGMVFTLGVLPWHWFYYAYSGLAFVLGSMRYAIGWWRSRAQLGTQTAQKTG